MSEMMKRGKGRDEMRFEFYHEDFFLGLFLFS